MTLLASVSRETQDKLEAYADILRHEAGSQNLVSRTTLDDLWDRHIIDSAQLAPLARPGSRWVDIGSGAGLPGVVLAILGSNVTLVEPRKLRAEFLSRTVAELGVEALVLCSKAERVTGTYDVITARAVAPLPKLLSLTRHLAHPDTLWVLPKGRNAKSELAEAQRSWHYHLRSEPSRTDPEAEILLLSNVKAKSER